MKLFTFAFLLLSSMCLADPKVGQIQGKIFTGGFIYSSRNYIPSTVYYDLTENAAQVRIIAKNLDCIRELGTGKLVKLLRSRLWKKN